MRNKVINLKFDLYRKKFIYYNGFWKKIFVLAEQILEENKQLEEIYEKNGPKLMIFHIIGSWNNKNDENCWNFWYLKSFIK